MNDTASPDRRSGNGVMRHADAGYELAIETARSAVSTYYDSIESSA